MFTPQKNRQILARQLLYAILTVSSLFTIMASALQLRVDYKKDVALLEQRIMEVQKTYVTSLGISIWNMDDGHVTAQLKGILQLPEISYLEVQTIDQTFHAGKKSTAIKNIVFEFPVFYTDPNRQFAPESVGTLIMHGDLSYIYTRLKDRILIIVGSQTIKTFSVSAFILFIIWSYVSRNLHIISKYAASMEMDKLSTPLVLSGKKRRKNELDMVADAINEMRESLIEARKKLESDLAIQQRMNDDLIRTIQARQKAEKSLKQSEYRFQLMVNNIPGAVYTASRNHSASADYISDAIEDITGYPASDFTTEGGRVYASLIHLDDIQMVKMTIRQGIRNHKSYVMEYRIHHRDGSIHWVNDKGQAIFSEANEVYGICGAIFDITEKKRTQEIMIQTEKMMSVGGLAAGMAHEINNPLAGMLQNAQVLANRVSRKFNKNAVVAKRCGTTIDKIADYMEQREIPGMIHAMIESGRRASRIVENMLSFSRQEDQRFTFQDMGHLLDRSLHLAETDFNLKEGYDFRNIEIIREYGEGTPAILCESTKLQQVFLNILKNGAEAMSESLAKYNRQPRFILRVQEEDGRIRIEIEDNGPGMTEEIRKRVFEPFFTTKDVGKGTGLGLSVSYFIITENHGGTMAIESANGQGTRFIIHLPI